MEININKKTKLLIESLKTLRPKFHNQVHTNSLAILYFFDKLNNIVLPFSNTKVKLIGLKNRTIVLKIMISVKISKTYIDMYYSLNFIPLFLKTTI